MTFEQSIKSGFVGAFSFAGRGGGALNFGISRYFKPS